MSKELTARDIVEKLLNDLDMLNKVSKVREEIERTGEPEELAKIFRQPYMKAYNAGARHAIFNFLSTLSSTHPELVNIKELSKYF